jgi:hypothetical protein
MTGAASNYSMGQSYPPGRCEHCGGLMVLVMPVDSKGPAALRCLECDRIDPLQLPSIAAWLVGERFALQSRHRPACVRRIEVRTLIVIMMVALLASSSAFARKASQHHSKRVAPKHQSTTKTDPGGVARDPNDVALDRKIGNICRGC